MSSEVKEIPETLESYRPLLFAIAYQMTGKATVVSRPLHGAQIVARFFSIISRKAPAETRVALSEANGMPALLGWEGETLTTVFLFAISDGRLAEIYAQRNPDKLIYLQRQLSQRG